MNRDRYLSVRYLSVFVAAAALIPTKVTAEAPECSSAPCHVELGSIEIDYPLEGDEKLSKAQTKITFTLQTKNDTWTLAASDDSGSDGGRSKQHYYRPSDGTLQLWYYMYQTPESNRIMLDETLPMTRSKKGRSFLSPVIEFGSSGTFTTGDIKQAGSFLAHGGRNIGFSWLLDHYVSGEYVAGIDRGVESTRESQESDARSQAEGEGPILPFSGQRGRG